MKKNIIINYKSDFSGHGTIRNQWPFETLNSIYAQNKDLISINQYTFEISPTLLKTTRIFYFQRMMSVESLKFIKHLKTIQPTHGFKMIWDIDDILWGNNELQGGTKYKGLPTYNAAWPNITDSIKETTIEIIKLMDEVSVSTEFLGNYINNTLGLKTKTTVIPNTVLESYWGEFDFKPITVDIKKPTILYTGSPSHYNNKDKLLGDWDNKWKDWVIQSVKNKSINFVVIGGLPWFFEPIKDLITVHPWVLINKLHLLIKRIKPDFCINPLVPNDFNYAKSDLKLVESTAANMICVGTVFDNKPSPFDDCVVKIKQNATVKEIDIKIKEFCKFNKFNNAINKQQSWFTRDQRWTEDTGNIKRLVKLLTE